MSMISGLIDSLRIHADLYDGKTQPPMNHELQRLSLAQELREAADTIWQLRDDLQRANAAVQDAEHDESMAWDRVRKAEAENAKMRELVEDMLSCIEIRAAFGRPPTDEMYETFAQRARELGMEVDV